MRNTVLTGAVVGILTFCISAAAQTATGNSSQSGNPRSLPDRAQNHQSNSDSSTPASSQQSEDMSNTGTASGNSSESAHPRTQPRDAQSGTSNSATQGSANSMGSNSGGASATGNSSESANPRTDPSSQNMASTKTLEGCVVSEGSDYFLVPSSGSPIHISGGDISHHVGHKVSVHGNVSNTARESDVSSGQLHSASTGEFAVERVEVLSSQCSK